MQVLTRDEILQVKDLQREYVETPEWAGGVWVRMLKGSELAEAMELLRTAEEDTSAEAQAIAGLCVLCICDDKGNRLFTKKDVDELLDGPLPPLKRCMDAALNINRLTDEAQDDLAGN